MRYIYIQRERQRLGPKMRPREEIQSRRDRERKGKELARQEVKRGIDALKGIVGKE